MADEYIGKNTTGGASFGKSTTEKVSLYGVTPIVQRSGAAQAVVATTAITTPATTAATSTDPYGFDSTQAAAILSWISSADTRIDALVVLANELRNALVALGAIKGSA